jgi:hypothetical protein
MDKEQIQAISKVIYRRFPEFAGTQPKIQPQRLASGKPGESNGTYLLTFQKKANLPGNKTLSRWVRVVANEQGKILKITTSH